MEKAMHSSHGMGYGEYNRRLENRLKVEESRQKEYEQCQKIVEKLQHG
jgi:hypothetical protein